MSGIASPPFGVDLRAAAERRWGSRASERLPETLNRLSENLAVLDRLPSVEPGAWPPPLPPADVPDLQAPSADSADDPAEAGVVALAAGIRDGRFSPVEVVEALLARARRLDSEIQSWALLDEDGARRAARQRAEEAARGLWRGPLHGVPVGVKDIFDVAGLPTRANSALRTDQPPAVDDAASVAALRRAGAILLGKTATTEFALSDPSGARNPWNPAHTPGGSSSGSAAAVSARLVPGALGSQTQGSVLRPAAFCGVVGFKPSAARISREGVIPLAWSLDHVGTFTRGVADAAALYATMAGATPVRPARFETTWPRLGVAAGFLSDHTDETTRDGLRELALHLRQKGCTVEEVALDELASVAPAVLGAIMWSEVAAFHLGAHADRLDQIGPRLRATIQAGSLIPAQALLRALGMRRLLFERWNRALGAYDAVLVPAASGVAPEGLGFTGDPSLNGPWTLLGVPAISIPLAVAQKGLPLGAQLVAAYGADARLLAVAQRCEALIEFKARPGL